MGGSKQARPRVDPRAEPDDVAEPPRDGRPRRSRDPRAEPGEPPPAIERLGRGPRTVRATTPPPARPSATPPVSVPRLPSLRADEFELDWSGAPSRTERPPAPSPPPAAPRADSPPAAWGRALSPAPAGRTPSRPAAGSSSPPRGALAREKEALAELARLVVRTTSRAPHDEAGNAPRPAALDELHRLLATVLEEQPQVGYVLHRTEPPGIFVDGFGPARVRLSEVLAGGRYELLVPRFVEAFERCDLVLLAFRRGITLGELERLVAVLGRARAGERRPALPDALLEAEVLHVSALSSGDVAERDPDLPWQVRVALARLRRDLRMVPAFRRQGPDAARLARRQIVADAVRPLQNPELLRQLVVFAPRIERDLARVEGLEGPAVTAAIVHELAPRPLAELARLLCEELLRPPPQGPDPTVAKRLRQIVELCARRLAKDESPHAEPVLRLLVERGFLGIDEVPAELSEWLHAEALHVRRERGEATAPPSGTPRDVRVLGKLARLALFDGRIDELADVVERLAPEAAAGDADAARALAGLFGPRELDGLVASFEAAGARAADHHARVLVALGARGATAMIEHLAAEGPHAHLGRAYHLLEGLPEAAGTLAAVLARPGLAPPALRLLLSLSARFADARTAAVAREHAKHPDPGVRLAALVSLIASGDPRAPSLLARAIEDADAAVAGMAMTALAERFGQEEPARRRALDVLEAATEHTPADVLLPAIRVLERFPGPPAAREATIAALRHAHEADRERAGFLGLGRRPSAHPDVLEATEHALEALGAPAEPARRSFIERLRGT